MDIKIRAVKASCPLRPGEHVGIDVNGNASPFVPAIGVVDPFLTSRVAEGFTFYLFMYPGLRDLADHSKETT